MQPHLLNKLLIAGLIILPTIVVLSASTIGAATAPIVARYLLRDRVRHKFGDKLQKINAVHSILLLSVVCYNCHVSIPGFHTIGPVR